MINPAPFIRKTPSRTYNRRRLGDDYRYLYVLNRRHQTVTVIDVSTNTVTATITLTAAKVFSSICYRPKDKTVWVFGTNSIDIIDANPASGGFNTLSANHTTTSGAGVTAVYVEPYDIFLYSTGVIDAKTKSYISLNYSSNYGSCFIRKMNLIFIFNINHGTTGTFKVVSAKKIVPDLYPFLVQYNVTPVKVGNFLYGGTNSVLNKTRVSSLQFVASLGVTQANNADMAYDPKNNRLWIGTNSNGSTNLQTVRLDTFTVDSTEPRTSPDTNESATRDILYCPYNGYIYAKGSNTTNPATGLGRVHYYNPTLGAGARYAGFVATGEDGSGGSFPKATMCFNGLKISDY